MTNEQDLKMDKPKTLKDIYAMEGPIQCCRDCKIDQVKIVAIKYFIYGVKKRKNPYKMFMDFFDITEEDMFEK